MIRQSIESILPEMPTVDRQTIRTWILIMMVFASLVYGSVDLVQGLEAGFLWLVGLVAFILVWILARTRIKARRAASIGIIGGFGFVFLLAGRLIAPVVNLLQSIYNYLALSIEAQEFGETLILQLAMRETLAGIQVLFTRLFLWLISIFSADTYRDPIVLQMVWGLAIWGMAAWLSWAIRRSEQPISGIIPAVIVLGYSLAYEGGNPFFLLLMLAAILLLAIFVDHDNREREWKRRRGKFPQIIRENIAWTAMIITAGLVTMAAITPSISVEDINEFYRKLTPIQSMR